LTRTSPSPVFATPRVAAPPLAVVGGDALELLPPQAARASTARGIAAKLVRKVIDLLRVMLAPFVLGMR